MKNMCSILAAGFLGTLAVSVFSTTATADVISLRIVNKEEVPVTIKLLGTDKSGRQAGSGYCYDPRPGGSGSVIGTIRKIEPGSHYSLKFDRYNGHCDGHGGKIHIEFQVGEIISGNGNRGTHKAYFVYDSRGNLFLDQNESNPYEGRLKLTQATSNMFDYLTPGTAKKLKAGKAIGEWKRICYEVCTLTHTKTVTSKFTSSTEMSNEEKNAISATLTAGVEMGAYSAEVSTTAAQERTMGRRMSKSFESGQTDSNTEDFTQYTSEKMRELGIKSIWQWVVNIKVGGKDKTIPSAIYSCSSNKEPPTSSNKRSC